jgi:hypothetical protein
MIEQGLVGLVQADGPVAAMSPAGGFFASIPKDFAPLPTWSYRSISDIPYTGLLSVKGLHRMHWQIDCYGAGAASAIALATAIDNVISGYSGNLPDVEQTYVSSIIPMDSTDFFDEVRRTYRRVLEYDIHYARD